MISPPNIVVFKFVRVSIRQALWTTSVSHTQVSGAIPPASPVLPMICAPPLDGSYRAVIQTATPAGLLAPLIHSVRESALDFAGGVVVDIAEGILSNLGRIGRRDVPAEVARRLIGG